MKIAVDRSPLLRALGHIQNIVSRRPGQTILSHILIRGDQDKILCSGTDLDIEIDITLEAKVDRDGVLTAPAVTLYDIVRKLPDGSEIVLETGQDSQSEGTTVVTAGNARFVLCSLDPEAFPKLSRDPLPHEFQLSVANLRDLLERTRFAMGVDEVRFYLIGVYLHTVSEKKKSTLRAVATDGHRLGRMEIDFDGHDPIPGVIVGRKTILEMLKIIEEGQGQIDIGLSEKKIRFTCGHTVVTSKLVDGKFPNYEKVIPKTHQYEFEVDAQNFAKSVERVSAISDKTRAIKLSLSEDSLVLSATGAESGSSGTDKVDNVAYKGSEFELGFNPRYLLDILEQFTGHKVRFLFSDTQSATMIQSSGEPRAVYVLMPMRV